MNEPQLNTEIAGIKFKTPILVASGTFGYGEEFSAYYDLNRLGGLIVKSLTLEPREGNAPQRIQVMRLRDGNGDGDFDDGGEQVLVFDAGAPSATDIVDVVPRQ